MGALVNLCSTLRQSRIVLLCYVDTNQYYAKNFWQVQRAREWYTDLLRSSFCHLIRAGGEEWENMIGVGGVVCRLVTKKWINFALPSRPRSAFRRRKVTNCPEVTGSVYARTFSRKTTDITVTVHAASLMTPTTELSLSWCVKPYQHQGYCWMVIGISPWFPWNGRGRRPEPAKGERAKPEGTLKVCQGEL